MKHSRHCALYCAGLLLLTGISASAQPSADHRSKQYWDYGYARDYGGEFGPSGANNQSEPAYPRENQQPQGYTNYPQENSTYYQGEETYAPQERPRRMTKPRRTMTHAAPVRTARQQSHKTRFGECLPGFHSHQDARGNFSCKSRVPQCPRNMAFQSVAPSDAGGTGPFEYRCFYPQN